MAILIVGLDATFLIQLPVLGPFSYHFPFQHALDSTLRNPASFSQQYYGVYLQLSTFYLFPYDNTTVLPSYPFCDLFCQPLHRIASSSPHQTLAVFHPLFLFYFLLFHPSHSPSVSCLSFRGFDPCFAFSIYRSVIFFSGSHSFSYCSIGLSLHLLSCPFSFFFHCSYSFLSSSLVFVSMLLWYFWSVYPLSTTVVSSPTHHTSTLLAPLPTLSCISSIIGINLPAPLPTRTAKPTRRHERHKTSFSPQPSIAAS